MNKYLNRSDHTVYTSGDEPNNNREQRFVNRVRSDIANASKYVKYKENDFQSELEMDT